jgi:hypothetical protein
MKEPEDFVEFPAEKINELQFSLFENQRAVDYLFDRGINKQSIFEFLSIGYSDKQDVIVVPLTAPDGRYVGLIGRSIDSKEFKNSRNLPRNRTLFNTE